jgi:hypothetical protein
MPGTNKFPDGTELDVSSTVFIVYEKLYEQARI